MRYFPCELKIKNARDSRGESQFAIPTLVGDRKGEVNLEFFALSKLATYLNKGGMDDLKRLEY